ncbi:MULTISPECIES: hypothetical protein [unclassified Actinotalea]|uniref:hypothetical protein n=1 Tax=unclassified Actinotalea TaxID=2638618 RepID=UPI0015F6D5D3|nr:MULTISPECIES: hypothetical protein [unclassified Actinotalea]
MAARPPFERPTAVPGWRASRWGYDPALECYWAELARDADGRVLRLGPERLLTTVPALARAVGHVTGVGDDVAYLALTA